ncbi:MAG TPA: hypothetical protein VE130_08510 [Nitrososphaeraceae archaeon]|nr:hypothetical protein [Nitrososphaeraceae archaeon]
MSNGRENRDLEKRSTRPDRHAVLAVIVPVMTITAAACVFTTYFQNGFAQQYQLANNQTMDNITIPLSSGFIDGEIAYFIATDASTEAVAASVYNSTGFNVNYAPSLANTTESARQQGYVFVNGAPEEERGPLGGQLSVATAGPGDPDYSPLFEINYVEWNTNDTSQIRILESAEEIMEAQQDGELTITKSNVVINSPWIVK